MASLPNMVQHGLTQPQRSPSIARGNALGSISVKAILTDRTLKALKPAPAGKRVVVWDAKLANFGCRVTDRGVVSFFVMRRLPGKKQPVRVVLGTYPATSLTAARKKAGDALADLATGIHPRERTTVERATEARRRSTTFAFVAEEFITRHLSRKRTGAVVGQLVRRELVSRWGDRPVTDITRADVIAMVEEIADASPSAARQAWIYCQRLFGWALDRDTYGLTASPCERVNITDLIGSPKARERTLTDSELRALWETIGAMEYPFDPFIRLLVLLGCRRGEAAGMRRSELDLDAALWHLPGDRVKNEQARTIPLPAQAVDLLRALPVLTGEYVFSTTHGHRPISGFAKVKQRLDRRLAGGVADWTLHDLRRTMRTHLSALPISGTVAEMMIGHKQKGIRAVYDRYGYLDEQRQGFELWAARLRDIVEPPPENIVRLAASR
jgi:integrase